MTYLKKIFGELKLNVAKFELITHNSFSSQVYKLTLKMGDNVILKIPSSREKLFRETKMLQRLAGTSLPVPTALDIWQGDEKNPGAILLSFIDGDTATAESVTEDLSYQMGKLLGELHSVPMPGFGHDSKHGFLYVENDDWWNFIWTKLGQISASSTPHLPTDTVRKMNDYFQAFRKDPPPVDGPCVVHADYRPGNILVKDGKVTGLIDFESGRGGSADFDFSKIKLYVWDNAPGTRKPFEDGYKSIRPLPSLSRLLDFNALFHALNHIDWCVKRGTTQNEQFLRENVSIVEKIAKAL